MELYLYCCLFYLWECFKYVPEDGWAFIAFGGRRFETRGPGLRLAGPWPASRSVVLGGLPFLVAGDRVLTRSPRSVLPRFVEPERWASLSALELSPGGPKLAAGGKTFLRTVSRRHSEQLAAVAKRLTEASAEQRAKVLGRVLDELLDVQGFAREFEAARQTTRWPRAFASLYWLAVFVAVPVAVRQFGSERGWLALLPFLGVLHVATWLLVARSSREFDLSNRAESLWIWAMYPPALLRAPFELVNDRVAGFHPIAGAVHLLKGPAREDFLRRAVGEWEHPWWRRYGRREMEGEGDLDVFRREMLGRMQRRLESAGRLPDPSVPPIEAASHCPVCLGDHRQGFAHCASCGVPTRENRPVADLAETTVPQSS